MRTGTLQQRWPVIKVDGSNLPPEELESHKQTKGCEQMPGKLCPEACQGTSPPCHLGTALCKVKGFVLATVQIYCPALAGSAILFHLIVHALEHVEADYLVRLGFEHLT